MAAQEKRLTPKQVTQIKRDLRFTDYGDLSATGTYSYAGRYVGRTTKRVYDAYGNDENQNPKHDRARKLLGVNSYARRSEVTKRLKRVGPLETTQQPIVLRQPAPAGSTLKQVVATIAKDPAMNAGIEALKERSGEFSSEDAMLLAGIANCEGSRDYIEECFDRIFSEQQLPTKVDEVVIGGGFHAAVYANVRVAMGHPKPLVLERSKRVGGTFAVSRGPSFFLNSRNRPGDLGIPGREEALNVLPSGPVQPADLSGDEFQRNADLAYCIRAALAMNARVSAETTVENRIGNRLYVEGAPGGFITAKRVVYATGLGEANRPDGVPDHDRILTFDKFMGRMDQPFPLRGMRNVAVIGSGDSGKTVIEGLMGQGPSAGKSVASLDFVEQVDWYGLDAEECSASGFVECNRARYKAIAANLPNGRAKAKARINPSSERANQVAGGYDGAIINGRRYDHVIWATGFTSKMSQIDDGTVDVDMMGRTVAKQTYVTDSTASGGYRRTTTYVVGPAAQIPLDSYEGAAIPANVPENSVALFRYAERTATLAANLPAAGEDELPSF